MAPPDGVFVLVSGHGRSATTRQWFFSTRRLRVARLAAVILVLALLAGVGAAGVALTHAAEYSAALATAASLRSTVADLREQSRAVESTLAAFTAEHNRIRVLAGLDSLPASVVRAGVGGPGSERVGGAGPPPERLRADLQALLRRTELLSSSADQAHGLLRANLERLGGTPTLLPTQGWVTSAYSRSRIHPVYRSRRPHEGIDVAAVRGTRIVAAADGRVVLAGRNGGYGLSVEIDHGFGYLTRYAHASRLLVEVGQQVRRGEVIARVGDTGVATGPHLHYEVWKDGEAVDPEDYIFP